MKLGVIFFASMILASTNACTPNIDLEAEQAEVKQVVDKFMQAIATEDLELISSLMAHDSAMVNFGTDAAERWVGWDDLEASLKKQFSVFDNSQVSVRDQVIRVGHNGSVAWYSQIVDWSLEAGGERVSVEGFRITGVLEKTGGKWRMVQLHSSVGVAGQAVEY